MLGLREQLDEEETEAFQLTGTIHLLVIAGLHLGILAGFAGLVLRRLLPWRWGLPAVAVFTFVYMLLVDAQPPVVRATVLIVAACGAVYFGRRRAGFNVLALAGLIVLVLNPVDLFNVGPQLSFLCVAGLMAMAPSWMAMTPSPDHARTSVKPVPNRIAVAEAAFSLAAALDAARTAAGRDREAAGAGASLVRSHALACGTAPAAIDAGQRGDLALDPAAGDGPVPEFPNMSD